MIARCIALGLPHRATSRSGRSTRGEPSHIRPWRHFTEFLRVSRDARRIVRADGGASVRARAGPRARAGTGPRRRGCPADRAARVRSAGRSRCRGSAPTSGAARTRAGARPRRRRRPSSAASSRKRTSGRTSDRYGDSTMTSGTPGSWRSNRRAGSARRASTSSVTWTAVTSSDIVRAKRIAWTTSRVTSDAGTMTRWWRRGGPMTLSSRTAVSTRRRRYCRPTSSIAPTRSGMMITISHAPRANLATAKMTATIAGRDRPDAVDRDAPPPARVRARATSGRPSRPATG